MDSLEFPLLSVLTPVYNGETFLRETLLSLVASDYPNIEFIVVDDGSQDGSAEIAYAALRNSGRPHKVLRKSNTGEADSDNYALAAARGEFIAIVNADDPVYPNLFSKSIAVLKKNSEVVVTYPDWEMIDETGNVLRKIVTRDYSLDALIGDNACLPGPGAVIRRSAIKSPMLRDPQFRFTSDYRQWLNLCLEGPFLRLTESLATWRVHSAQQSVKAAGIDQAKEMIRCIEDFFSEENLPSEVARLRNQAFSQAYYLAAIQSLHRAGVPGRRYLLKSLTYRFKRRVDYQAERKSIEVFLLIISNPLGRFLAQRAIAKSRTENK